MKIMITSTPLPSAESAQGMLDCAVLRGWRATEIAVPSVPVNNSQDQAQRKKKTCQKPGPIPWGGGHPVRSLAYPIKLEPGLPESSTKWHEQQANRGNSMIFLFRMEIISEALIHTEGPSLPWYVFSR